MRIIPNRIVVEGVKFRHFQSANSCYTITSVTKYEVEFEWIDEYGQYRDKTYPIEIVLNHFKSGVWVKI